MYINIADAMVKSCKKWWKAAKMYFEVARSTGSLGKNSKRHCYWGVNTQFEARFYFRHLLIEQARFEHVPSAPYGNLDSGSEGSLCSRYLKHIFIITVVHYYNNLYEFSQTFTINSSDFEKFSSFFFVCWIFSKFTFLWKFFHVYHQSAKELIPDQAQYFVGPDLGPNCLQRSRISRQQNMSLFLKQGKNWHWLKHTSEILIYLNYSK